MKSALFLLCFFLCFSACQNDKPKEQDKPSVVLPNTPETVAQEWLEALYNGDLEKTVVLGTDLTRMTIDSIKKEIEPNAPVIEFEIYDMLCEVQKDSAFCSCLYKEEGDEYPDYVNLLFVNGQWLVDEPWDEETEGDSDLDLFIEEAERIMMEELKKETQE